MDKKRVLSSYAARIRDFESQISRENEARRQQQRQAASIGANEGRNKVSSLKKQQSSPVDDKLPWDSTPQPVDVKPTDSRNFVEQLTKNTDSLLKKNSFIDYIDKKNAARDFFAEQIKKDTSPKSLRYIDMTNPTKLTQHTKDQARKLLEEELEDRIGGYIKIGGATTAAAGVALGSPLITGLGIAIGSISPQWGLDAYTVYGVNANQAQADDYSGKWNRQQEWIDAANDAIRDCDNRMQRDAIQRYLDAFDKYNEALNTNQSLVRTRDGGYINPGAIAKRDAAAEISNAVKGLQSYYGANFNPEKNPQDFSRMYADYNRLDDEIFAAGTADRGSAVLRRAALGYGATGGVIKQAIRALGLVGTDEVDQSLEQLRYADQSNPAKYKQQLLSFVKSAQTNQDKFKQQQRKELHERDEFLDAHKISDNFTNRMAKAQSDMAKGGSEWTVDNLLYNQVAQAGFSASSWYYQYPGMFATLAGNALIETGAGALPGAALAATGSLLSYKAGETEGNATVLDIAADRIKLALKGRNPDGVNYYNDVIKEARNDKRVSSLSEDQIMQAIAKGDWLPTQSRTYEGISDGVRLAIAEGRKGSNTYYDQSMTAVASDAALDFMLYGTKGSGKILEYGGALGKKALGGTVRGVAESAKTKIIKSAPGKAAKYTYTTIKDGANAAKYLGVGGYAVGPVVVAAKDAVSAAGKAAAKTKVISDIAKSPIGQAAAKAADKTVQFLKNVPTWLLDKSSGSFVKGDGKKAIAKQFKVRQFLKRAAAQIGNLVLEGYGEEIEEGKQATEGNDWLNNATPEQVTSMYDNILTDLSRNVQLIPAAMGVPFGLHLGMASDNDVFANMAGGLLGGWFHGGAIQGGSLALQEAINATGAGVGTKSLDDIILTNAHLDVTGSVGTIQAGERMAKEVAKHNNLGRFLQEVDAFKEFNSRQRDAGNIAFEDSQIDSQKDFVKSIYTQYYSPDTEQQAEKAGIKKGSKDYYRFVSLKSLYGQLRGESKQNLDAIENSIQKSLNRSKSVIEASTVAFDEDENNPILELFKAKEQPEGSVEKKQSRRERRLANVEKNQRSKALNQQNADDALQSFVAADASDSQNTNLSDAEIIKNGIGTILELVALTRQLQTIKDVSSASSLIRDNDVNYVTNAIETRINELKELLPEDRVDDVIQHPEVYVTDENADELIDLFQQRMSAKIHNDTNNMMYRMLTGNLEISADQDSDGRLQLKKMWGVNNAKDILNAVQKTIDDQYDLVDRVNKEFQQRNLSAQENASRSIERSAEQEEIDEMLKSADEPSETAQLQPTEKPEKAPKSPSETVSSQPEPTEEQVALEAAKEAKKEEIRENYTQQVAEDEGAAAAVESVEELTVTPELKEGDKVVVIDKKTKDYEVQTVSETKDGQVLKAVDEEGTPSVVQGNPVPEDQKQRLKDTKSVATSAQQQSAMDRLNEKIAEDEKSVVGVSDMHYFIKDGDGVVRMHKRVHTVKGDMYENGPELDKDYSESDYNKNKRAIISFLENNDLDGLRKKFGNIKSLDLYLDQLQQDRDEVIDVLAQIASKHEAGVGVKVGQIVDELVRIFFDSEINKAFDYETLTVMIDGKEYLVSLFISKQSFESFKNDLTEVLKTYNALGYKLSTKRHVWFATMPVDGKLERVAGETDIIAIDQNGKYHIIDTKTTKYSFKEGSAYFDQLGALFGRAAKRTTREDYAMQLSYYMAIIKNAMPGVEFSEHPIELLPVVVNYDKVAVEHAFNVYGTGETLRTAPINSFSIGKDDEPSRVELVPVDSIVNGKFDNKDDDADKYKSLKKEKLEVVNLIAATGERIEMFKGLLEEHHAGLGSTVDFAKPILKQLQDRMRTIHDGLKTQPSGSELDKIQSDLISLQQDATLLFDRLDAVYRQGMQTTFAQDTPVQTQPVTAPVSAAASGWTQCNTADRYTVDNNIGSDGKTILRDVTGIEDFGTSSVTEVVQIKRRGNGDPIIVCKITYNGVTFDDVEVLIAKNQKGDAMLSSVEQLRKTKQEGQKIILSGMDRTTGLPNYVEEIDILDSAIMQMFGSIYDVSTESTQNVIGLAKADKDGIVHIYRQGAAYGTETSIYTFPKGKGVVGTWATVIKPNFRNATVPTEPLVMPIMQAKLSDGDADFLIDLLEDVARFGTTENKYDYYDAATSRMYTLPLTYKHLIEFFIPYGDVSSRSNTEHVKVVGNVVTFSHRESRVNPATRQKEEVTIVTQFNLADAEGKSNLKKYLMSLRIDINKNRVQQRLGLATDQIGNNPFGAIANFFNSHKNIPYIRFGNSRITFGQEDFYDPNSKSSLGLSGMGWMIKNGMLRTNYGGVRNPRFSYTKAELVSETPVEDDQTVTPESIMEPSVNSDDAAAEYEEQFNLDEYLDLDDGLYKIQRKSVSQTIDERSARKHLRKILGKHFPVSFVDNIAEIFSDKNIPAGVVGLMKNAAIYLQNNAGRGTEYHEAFHVVSRLLLPKKWRDALYKRIRQYMKEEYGESYVRQLESKYHEKERVYEEYGADLCQDYFNRVEEIPFSIRNVFNYIRENAQALREIGDYRLAALFVSMRLRLFTLPYFRSTKRNNVVDSSFAKEHTFSAHGVQLPHIMNDAMYEALQKSLLYYIIRLLNIKASGNNISKLDLSEKMLDKRLPKRDRITGKLIKDKDGNVIHIGSIRDAIIKSCQTYNKETKKHEDNDTSLAVKEIFDNWNSLKQDFVTRISENFGVEYHDEDEEALSGDITEAGEERIHGKASYEESRITKATTGIKFFASMIKANGRVIKVTDKKSNEEKYTIVYDKNQFGLYEFMDGKEVLCRLLNDLHGIKSVDQLKDKMSKLGQTDPMYFQLSAVLNNAIARTKRKDGSINYNAEQYVTQLFNFVACQRNRFMRVSAERSKRTSMYTITVEPCGQSYESRQYRMDWGRLLVYGGSKLFGRGENGSITVTQYQGGVSGIDVLGSIFDKLKEIKREFLAENLIRLRDNGTPSLMFRNLKTGKMEPCNVTTEEGAKEVINRMCSMFNYMGILFDVPEFEYMLTHKYLDSGFETLSSQLELFFSQTGKANIENLWSSEYKFINQDDKTGKWYRNWDGDNRIPGKKRNIPAENLFVSNSFAAELSDWKYKYQHSFTDMQVLVTAGKNYYEISENNLISDIVDEINDGGQVIDDLAGFNYNYLKYNDNGEEKVIGGLILKQALKKRKVGKHLDMKVNTLVQFKTNGFNDTGAGYFDISEREDYVSKCAILQGGGLVAPTMSDKKTWVYITGVEIPGLQYAADLNELPSLKKSPDAAFNDAIDQIIEYADLERACVEQTIQQVKTLDKSQLVTNFHKGAKIKSKDGKEHTIPNGAVFGSLTGIYKKNEQTGKPDFISFSRFLDDNGKFVSPEDNLRKATEEFFSKSPAEKREIIKYTLELLVDKEMQYVEELGLIKSIKDSQLKANVGLDDSALEAIARFKNKGAQNITEFQKDAVIRDYIRDIVCRHIMSIHEIERNISGHPGFFKYKFDEKTGSLINRKDDEFKRFGGLISTGVNNNTSIEGAPSDGQYTCCVVDNDTVQSPLIEYLEKIISEAEYRKVVRQAGLYKKIDDPNKIVDQTREIIGPKASAVVDAKVKKIVDSYKKNDENEGIDVSDGASYISPQMTKWLLQMCGEYDNRVNKAFEILENPDKYDIYTQKDAYALVTTKVIGAQKYTAYGMRKSSDKKVMIPYYNKTALFPVFKCIATGKFAKIYDQMQNNTDDQGNPDPIHMLMVKSAVKLGDQGSVLYTPGCKLNTYKQPFSRLRKQFNTNPHHKDEQAMGTQTAKVALSTLVQDTNYNVEGLGEMSGETVLQTIMSRINYLSKRGAGEFNSEIMIDGKIDPLKFSEFLKEQLSSRDADRSILESIDAVPIKDENRQTVGYRLRHPLAAISRMGWLLSIITSAINKKVVDVNTPGNAFYQRSVWGMEGHAADFIDDENLPADINGGEKLKMVVEEGPAKNAMECVLTIDYFADILEKAGLKDASFDEQKRALIEAGVIGKNAKSNIIGYRIPTQAQSSIHALVCVDVLPVIQHTIILPQEFTKITGSDFDIDKIYLSSTNIEMLKNDNGVYEQQHISDDKKRAQNDLLNCYLSVLLSPDNMSAGNRPVDEDTSLLKDVLKDLELGRKSSGQHVDPFDFYKLSTHTDSKNNFLTGKVGIGPFALNNNSLILTMLYGVKFSRSSVMGQIGATSLYSADDMDGKPILSWISGLINAHVDIAKDPWISRLNVNPMTYNLTNLLIRTGFGKRTFYFLKQPGMIQMAKKYAQANGQFIQDPNRTMWEIRNLAKQDAIIELVGKDTFDRICTEFGVTAEKPTGTVIQDAKYLLTNGEVLREIAKNENALKESKTYEVGKRNLTAKEIQVVVYLLDKALEAPAQAISDLVKYSKIDTKKQGKNTQEQLAYLRGVANTFGDFDITRDLFGSTLDREIEVETGNPEQSESGGIERTSIGQFEAKGLTRMYEESFILQKTRLAVYTFMGTLRGQVLEATPVFQNIVQRLCDYFNRTDDTGILAISDALAQHIKAVAINDYAHQEGIDIHSLVSGNNTIYDRLNILKNKANTDPEYAYLKNNAIIQLLIGDKVWQYNPGAHPGRAQDPFSNLKFVRLFDALDVSSSKRDFIISAWDNLLNDGTHKDVQEFARDLCVYAFVTSGDMPGRTKLFSYVPNSFREQSGYVTALARVLEDLNTGDPESKGDAMYTDKLIDDIALNHWKNSTFVRSINVTNKDWREDSGQPLWQTISMNRQIPGANYKPTYPIFVTADVRYPVAYENCPKFVSIKAGTIDDGSVRSATVYKLVSFMPVVKADENGETVDTRFTGIPLYVKVNQKSHHIDGGYDFYEFDSFGLDNEYFPTIDLLYNTRMAIFDNIEMYEQTYSGPFRQAVEMLDDSILFNRRGMKQVEQWLRYDDTTSYPVPEKLQKTPSVSSVTLEPFDVSKAEFYSGAASGSDTVWGTEARSLGINVIDYTRETWNSLTQEWKDRLSAEYEDVAKALARPVIPLGARGDIEVRRDMMQSDKADAIFAVGTVVKPGQKGAKYINKSDHDVVDGGTGYAVQRGIIRNIPVYVFDQSDNQWKVWDDGSNSFIPTFEPTLTLHAATIGTREISDAGKQAIKSILTKTIKNPANTAPQPEQDLGVGQQTVSDVPAHYEGTITPDDNTIFVFGSNPEGRHGAGAAKVARDQFGAIYGQGEGLQGNAYALPTKDLRVKENKGLRSISAQQITENIRKMYEVAKQNPDKQFKVAYTNGLNETSLNGYSGAEMIKMFKDAGPIPSNVVFSKNWVDHWSEVQSTNLVQQHETELQNGNYILEDNFIQQIKQHIASDDYSKTIQNYVSDRVRKSLIAFTDTLFDYVKKNNVKLEFKRADKNNRAGGASMIYVNNDGDGYVIEVDTTSETMYLDILHEILHAITNPFDNQIIREMGGEELPEQLMVYYDAFIKKVLSQKKYSDARNIIQQFKDKKITRDQLNSLVSEEVRDVMHALESPGEFLSSFISSNTVQTEVTSITIGDKSLFEELISYIKDFLSRLFKGYSYVDSANVIDDITDFLIKYDGKYKTPKQIVEPISFGKVVLESGEVLYGLDDIKTNLISYGSDLYKYANDKDLLKSMLSDFNKEVPLGRYQETGYGSYDGKSKLFTHIKNRWVVRGINQQKFKLEGQTDLVTGVEFARVMLPEWLRSHNIPSDFIQITDGGLVRIEPRFIVNSYFDFKRGSVIVESDDVVSPDIQETDDLLQELKSLGEQLMKDCEL